MRNNLLTINVGQSIITVDSDLNMTWVGVFELHTAVACLSTIQDLLVLNNICDKQDSDLHEQGWEKHADDRYSTRMLRNYLVLK
jgi:hypothetical protein